MKNLDVNAAIRDRAGEPVEEPKTDKRGRIVLASGEAKYSKDLLRDDDLKMEVIRVGKIMILALDTQDEKIDHKERVSRFMLSVRIEEAMQAGKPLEMERDDEDLLSKVLKDKITNHMFLARSLEALDDAEKVEKSKANGKHAELGVQ